MDTIGVPPKVRQQSRHVASRRCLTSSAHPVPKVTFTSILLAVPLSTTPGRLSYHVPCDERLAGDSSHPPLPSLRLGRSFVFQPAAGLRQEELQIPAPWRNQPQRYGREKTQLCAIRIPCRPCRGGQGEPPEPNFTKREKLTTRRCQARTIFVGGIGIVGLGNPPNLHFLNF